MPEESIRIVTGDRSEPSVSDDTNTEIDTEGQWDVEMQPSDAANSGVEVTVSKLEQEMAGFLREVDGWFSRAEQQADMKYVQLDEFEIPVKINTEGKVSLLGSEAKVDGDRSMILRFKRRSAIALNSKSGTNYKNLGNFLAIPIPRFFKATILNHIFTGACALIAAIATAANPSLVQEMEYNVQTLFFELRGPIAPPDNIAILAIDDESLLQGREFYRTNPKGYAYLEPLKEWPWKRAAYAQVIDKLMAAGARSVAVDVLFDTPSRYGKADDERLRQTLQRYAGRVTLAAFYEDIETRQGSSIKLTLPHSQFWTQPMSVGSINSPLEADDRIHRFASEHTKLLAERYKKQVKDFDVLKLKTLPDFQRAALQATKLNYPKPKGDRIHFYGPDGTFKHIPFWYVLDPENWNIHKEQFKDKIVLVGPTASELKDFHRTPFSQGRFYPEPMQGIEIHANAIATLLEGRSIAQAIPNPLLRSVFVFAAVVGTGVLLSRRKQALTRLICAIAIGIAWVAISFFTFSYSQFILPTAVPVIAIALIGLFMFENRD